jgi:SAM-dependent methyltransferase
VGPTGHVVAIDQDIRHLGWIHAPNISVRAQDIVVDGLERGQFDLVHFRALLEHVHDVDRAVQQMVDALVPGGWLLAEGADFERYRAVDKSDPLAAVFDHAMSKTFSFIKAAGLFDPFVISSVPALLERMGLVEIAVADESIIWGGSPEAAMFETSWEAFDPVLSANGVLADQEIAVRHAAHENSTFSFTSGAFAAWGRHP